MSMWEKKNPRTTNAVRYFSEWSLPKFSFALEFVSRRSNAELKATAQKTMITMHQDALQKAADGVTSLEEILRVSSGDLLE